jgi:polygalacturonase
LSRIKAPRFPNRTLIITDTPYNAIADGSTDARQGIQNAIINVSRFGGGTVSLPRGEYYVDGPLKLEKKCQLPFWR